MELNGTHMMEMAKRSCLSAQTWKRRKRKTKPNGDQGKRINRDFCFANQDAIECVIGFRIDSRTIKRRTLIVIKVI
jgi:hypothetical protein